jgi:nitrite reductase/ring-hydroxylating ferredoxin subunit
MIARLISICPLSHLAEGRAQRVVAPDGTVLVCVRRGAAVDVLDDRCPHEGHPLSMGLVRDGTLTCAWHNWRFALDTGDCVAGDEGTLRYPSEVHHGEVFVDLAPDLRPRIIRAARDLQRALHRGTRDGAVRDALRLDALTGSPTRAVSESLGALAARAPEGVTDALTAAHAAESLCDAGVITGAERHAVITSAVIEHCAGRAPRPVPASTPCTLDEVEPFLLDLLDERRREAQSRVLGLPDAVSAEAVARAWLLPFASLKLWDLGAALPRIAALTALSPRLSPELTRALTAGLAVSLGASYAPSDLPAWHSTRRALTQVRALPTGDGGLRDPDGFCRDVCVSEAQAVHAVLVALSEGASPRGVLDALCDAACARLSGFTPIPRGALVRDALEAGQCLVFLTAARALHATDAPWSVAHAVLGAGFVGKLRRHDAARPRVTPRDEGLDGLRDALSRREPDRARGVLAGLRDDDLADALREVVRFGALRSRGELARGAPLAWALWQTGTRPGSLRSAAEAGVQAFLGSAPPDLVALAQEAQRVVHPRPRRRRLRDGGPR